MKRETKHIATVLIIITLPLWLIVGFVIKAYELVYNELWDDELFKTDDNS